MSSLSPSVRSASSHDIDAIGAVHRASAITAYRDIFEPSVPVPTADQLARSWRELGHGDDSELFVAVVGDRVVGAAALASDGDAPHRFVLARLYVHPDHWCDGHGRRLHDRVIDAARSRGLTALNLWVLEENVSARIVYERWGWTWVPGPTLPNRPSLKVDVLYETTL